MLTEIYGPGGSPLRPAHDPPTLELLTLALGTHARRSPRSTAAALLDTFHDLPGLLAAGPDQIARIEGMSPRAAIRLHAALALGRSGGARTPPQRVGSPPDALAHLRPLLDDREQEAVVLLPLGRRLESRGARLVSLGGTDFAVVEPRQILTLALRLGATAMIVGHNHPSGDPEPSPQDLSCTRLLSRACEAVGVRLLDHLVVAGDAFVSLAQRGELTGWRSRPGP